MCRVMSWQTDNLFVIKPTNATKIQYTFTVYMDGHTSLHTYGLKMELAAPFTVGYNNAARTLCVPYIKPRRIDNFAGEGMRIGAQ